MLRRATFFAALLLPLLAIAVVCSQLGLLETGGPVGRGVRVAATGVAFGADQDQKLDIYVPSTRNQALPVAVFIHGGAWNSGSRADYGFVGKAFAARGFVAVLPDYRLAPKVSYPAFVEDGAAAVAWVHANIARYGGDPRRIFLVGYSAGAYNAMMIALAPEFLGKQGLSPSILSGVAGLSGPYDFLPLDGPSMIAAFGAAPDLPSTQPVNRATSSAIPPVFLATGDRDNIVPPRNTSALAAALGRAGKTVEIHVYPGLTHVTILRSLKRLSNVGRENALDDMVHFFNTIDVKARSVGWAPPASGNLPGGKSYSDATARH